VNHWDQCALAAAGQLTVEESRDFQLHLAACEECRQRLGAYERISDLLATAADARMSSDRRSGVPERLSFVIHAGQDPMNNVPRSFQSRTLPPRHRMVWATPTLLLAACLIGIFLGSFLHLTISKSSAPSPADHSSQFTPATPNNKEGAPNNSAELDTLKKDLASAGERERIASLKLQSLQQQLSGALTKQRSLEGQVTSLQAERDDLAGKGSRREAEYSQVKRQLDQARSEKEALQSALLAEEAELGSLKATVHRLTAEIEQQALAKTTMAPCQSLNARNLHVVDVHDTESDGTISRAFGRIFYVEGQCLTFYAFDLPDKAVHQTVAFYVWGGKGDSKTFKKLGVFHRDDPSDGRWLLSFEDAAVLAQINNVFVTMEPETIATTRPQGKMILQAFLGNKAKHP
jgi:hypothetical protein